MATIAAWVDAFDGTNNATATTSNTGADSITGTASYATFTTTAGEYQTGTAALECAPTLSDTVSLRYDAAAQGLAYLDIYLQVATLPSTSTMVLNWFNSTTKVGDIRVVPGSGVFQFQLRDVTTAKWTSQTLPLGWYRLAVKVDPGSSTGHQVRVFSGAGIDSTVPAIDSGGLVATGSGATTIDNIRLGFLSAATGVVRFDSLTASDSDWPTRSAPPAPVTSVPVKARQSGAWTTGVTKVRQAGAWV
jgi:hypothetical protein